MDNVDYADVLTEARLPFASRGPWYVVGETSRTGGWKLHISAVPHQAEAVLRTVVPVLKEMSVPFKSARHSGILAGLNCAEYGDTQVGKFMTVYPPTDGDAVRVAETLIDLTSDFAGPSIPSDAHLGGLVYTRYGGFSPRIVCDRLGHEMRLIEAGSGTWLEDTYQVPFRSPDSVHVPFESLNLGTSEDVQETLFGPGFRVLEILRPRATGSTFLALDLRDQKKVGIVVLKQARPHCYSDMNGRDGRSRLRHQEHALKSIASLACAPACGEYFEVHGTGYLPFEFLPGESVEKVVAERLKSRPWASAPAAVRRELIQHGLQLIERVARLHEHGWIHRDVSANNVWITKEGVRLLDFELACQVDVDEPAFSLGTTGFMSPNQAQRGRPEFADDVYGVGAVLTLLLTGMDPRRMVGSDTAKLVAERVSAWMDVPRCQELEVICAATSPNPQDRPPLNELSSAVARLEDPEPSTHRRRSSKQHIRKAVKAAVERGLIGLTEDVEIDDESGLPLSAVPVDNGSSFELRLSKYGHYGLAGLLSTWARAARLGFAVDRTRVSRIASWLTSHEPTADPLPGLYFGTAGVAVSLSESVAAELLPRSIALEQWIDAALARQPDWPDLTHGASGQGFAALQCARLLGRPELTILAGDFASYLIKTQEPSGSWIIPDGVPGISGERLTGLAHGAAGAAMFLAAYAEQSGDQEAEVACRQAVSWLLSMRKEAASGVEWPYSDQKGEGWRWWCHGGPGIALALLRIGRSLRDNSYNGVAAKALQIHPMDLRWPNFSQCHGLAGLGEIYLEAARILGDRSCNIRAERLALLFTDMTAGPGRSTWLVESPAFKTADLMTGSAGIIHFLLRYLDGDHTLGSPLLAD